MTFKDFKTSISDYKNNNPLAFALLLGGFFRLMAVIFSKGFGMHDDHFLVIEAAQSWVDGKDYNNWLPSSGATSPSGHSFFYVGLHYLFFRVLEFLGIFDAQLKMFIVRLVHATYSMLVIVLGFKITNHYAGKKQAGTVALLLACLFFMPVLSVRNLVEVVCVPLLMYCTWLLVKAEKNSLAKYYLLAGLFAGLAFSVRYQSSFFIVGFGLYFLFKKNVKGLLFFSMACIACMAAVQSPIDIYHWGYPFAEFMEYVNYNIQNATSYFNKPWYMYFILLGGILIPPVSIFLLWGYFRNWKKHLLLFLPAFVFLAYHSYFPNKQERFIFPVIPFIIMLGIIGWNELQVNSKFWQRNARFINGSWVFLWLINFVPLCFLSVSYIKKDRIEAMRFLSRQANVKAIVMEDTNHRNFIMPTLFYMETWPTVYGLSEKNYSDTTNLYSIFKNKMPQYAVFVEDDNLDARVRTFERNFAKLQLDTVIKGGMLDATMHFLNPVNKYQSYNIYKVIY